MPAKTRNRIATRMFNARQRKRQGGGELPALNRQLPPQEPQSDSNALTAEQQQCVRQMTEQLYKRTTLRRLRPHLLLTLDKVIRTYTADVQIIASELRSLREFFDLWAIAAIDVHAVRLDPKAIEKFRELATLPPDLAPAVLRAELIEQYENDPAGLLRVLKQHLQKICERPARDFFAVLNCLDQAGLVGRFKRFGKKACRFTFVRTPHRTKESREVLAELEYARDSLWWPGRRVVEQVTVVTNDGQERHTHDVFAFKLLPLNRIPESAPPAIRKLIAATPVFLQQQCSLVDGQEIFEQVVSPLDTLTVQTHIETWHRDPALILTIANTSYCLAGWGLTDAQQKRPRRQVQSNVPCLLVNAAAGAILGTLLYWRMFGG